ncbi:hypothetical protein L2E82_16792 [Cichorium intybus]|uniref:Uncharacterized protein n=1 Tax=Cichorium intybus TaxID=13427 RepID=A0ACB9F7U1_CICIN|nr:hypothetical protein L2E82_16792 [Cichorium intybus]
MERRRGVGRGEIDTHHTHSRGSGTVSEQPRKEKKTSCGFSVILRHRASDWLVAADSVGDFTDPVIWGFFLKLHAIKELSTWNYVVLLDRNSSGFISADEFLSVPEFAVNLLSQVHLS